ncbi:MAG: hypothetical protein EHM93_10200 [Bacteroidales bacterium]|nr:MAG: hypothetical protein EHM93_10200 [Bacteroidales bacterium]
MKLSDRFTLGLAYFSGVLTIIIGLLHNGVIHTQLPHIQMLSQEYKSGWIWLFLCTGTAVAFCGVLCVYAARGLMRKEKWARHITLISCIFLGAIAVSAVIIMQGGRILLPLVLMSLWPWWKTRG